MPMIPTEDRARIKASHPDAFVLRSAAAKGHEFVFKPVATTELDAFLGAVNSDDGTEKVYAHRTLAADCVLFPSRDVFQSWAKENGAIAHAFGTELVKKSGMSAEVQSDAL
jgi:hypothetical protein